MAGRRFLAVVVVGVACLGFAAGCGGGEAENATTGFEDLLAVTGGGEASEPVPAPTPPTVVVRIAKGSPIAPGSRGDHVAALQTALKELGYKVTQIDGAYGPQTRDAIMAFQKDHKLRRDGIAGAKTVKAINEELQKLAADSTG